MSSKGCGTNVGVSWYLGLSGSYFLGGNTRGENNESSTPLRYNRCNREDTARILTATVLDRLLFHDTYLPPNFECQALSLSSFS